MLCQRGCCSCGKGYVYINQKCAPIDEFSYDSNSLQYFNLNEYGSIEFNMLLRANKDRENDYPRYMMTLYSYQTQYLSNDIAQFFTLLYPLFRIPLSFYASSPNSTNYVPNLSALIGSANAEFQFLVTVDGYDGDIHIKLTLWRNENGDDRWTINLRNVVASKISAMNIQEDTSFDLNDSDKKSYDIRYSVNNYAQIVFPRQGATFNQLNRGRITRYLKVRWQGTMTSLSDAYLDISCVQLYSANQLVYFVKFSDKQYCSSSCSSSPCRIMCLGRSHVYSNRPSFCDGNYCPMYQKCINTQWSYQCGLPEVQPRTKQPEYPCAKCAKGTADCQLVQGKPCCKCKPGYFGSGVNCLLKGTEQNVIWYGKLKMPQIGLESSLEVAVKGVRSIEPNRETYKTNVKLGTMPYHSNSKRVFINTLLQSSQIFDIPMMLFANRDGIQNLYQRSSGEISANITTTLESGLSFDLRILMREKMSSLSAHNEIIVEVFDPPPTLNYNLAQFMNQNPISISYIIHPDNRIEFPKQASRMGTWKGVLRLGACATNTGISSHRYQVEFNDNNLHKCGSTCERGVYCSFYCNSVPSLMGPYAVNQCTQPCHRDAECINSRCVCKPGWSGTGTYCTKDPECRRDDDCQRKFGLYSICRADKCSCRPGTAMKLGTCSKIYECTKDTDCHVATQQCSRGINKCLCRPNFIPSRTVIVPSSNSRILECTFDCQLCDSFSTFCSSTGCHCKPGFKQDYTQALTKECFFPCRTDSQCPTNEQCDPTKSLCVCPGNKQMNGQCLVGPANDCRKCHKYATCRGNKCVCINGYSGNGVTSCQVVSRVSNCRTCFNYRYCDPDNTGGTCRCPPNFKGDGKICLPDQCLDNCRPGSQCTLRDGAWKCVCSSNNKVVPPGYYCPVVTPAPIGCKNCHQNATCLGNKCKCNIGYVGDGVTSCKPKLLTTNCGECFDSRFCTPDKYGGICICPPELKGDGKSCLPDFCKSNCQGNSKCIPTGNKWQCFCITTNRVIDAGYPCEISTTAASTSTTKRKGCIRCHKLAECQRDKCVCKVGYRGDGQKSCETTSKTTLCPKCYDPVKCEPNDSGGNCKCPDGLKGDGIRCLVDHCKPNCLGNSICLEIGDAWKCFCRSNNKFIKAGVPCGMTTTVPPKGCKNCHKFARCQSDKCVCKIGFQGNGYTECNTTKMTKDCPNCYDPRGCTASKGGGYCECPSGLKGDGKRCLPDLCKGKCMGGSKCLDLLGTYRCLCIALSKIINAGDPCPESWKTTSSSTTKSTISSTTISSSTSSSRSSSLASTTSSSTSITTSSASTTTSPLSTTSTKKPSNCTPECNKNETCVKVNGTDKFKCKPEMKCNTTCDTKAHKVCNTTKGKCECMKDYVKNVDFCQKDCRIDGKAPCHRDAHCLASSGMCRCQDGFMGNGVLCIRKMADCKTSGKLCHKNSNCTYHSQVRANICQCNPGYVSVASKLCAPIRNCANTTDANCGKNGTCETIMEKDLFGKKYMNGICLCEPGYSKSSTYASCKEEKKVKPDMLMSSGEAIIQHSMVNNKSELAKVEGSIVPSMMLDCLGKKLVFTENDGKKLMSKPMTDFVSSSTMKRLDKNKTDTTSISAIDHPEINTTVHSGDDVKVGKIVSLAIDEWSGLVIYSDYNTSKIVVADMATNRKAVLDTTNEASDDRPQSIVVDSDERMIYVVVGAYPTRIESMTIEGDDRNPIIKLERPPTSLVLRQDKSSPKQLCWTDMPSPKSVTSKTSLVSNLYCLPLSKTSKLTIDKAEKILTLPYGSVSPDSLNYVNGIFYWASSKETKIYSYDMKVLKTIPITAGCCDKFIHSLTVKPDKCQSTKRKPCICKGICIPLKSDKTSCMS